MGLDSAPEVDKTESHMIRDAAATPLSIIVRTEGEMKRDSWTRGLIKEREAVSVNLILTRDLPVGTLLRLPSESDEKYVEITGDALPRDAHKSFPNDIFARLITPPEFDKLKSDRRRMIYSWNDHPLVPLERAKLPT